MIVMHIAEYAKGGIATYLKNVIDFQSKQNDIEKVCLVCSDFHEEEFKGLIDDKIEMHTYKYTRKLTNFLSAIMRIGSIIKAVNPDIIHVHSSFAGMFVRIKYFFQKKNVKIIYCSHGWSFLTETGKTKKKVFAYVEKLLSLKTDIIVNISEYEYNHSLNYGMPVDKSVTIYNGVSFSPKDEDKPSNEIYFDQNKINLLFVGRFDRQKGIDILLDTFKRNNFDNLNLYLVGDSVLGNSNIDIPPNVKKVGWLPSEQIDYFYRNVDAIVMPSRWEGFGLVAVEAMKHKKAVIASDRGALPELVINEQNGYIFKLDNQYHLTDLLNNLNKEKLVGMGEKGYDIYTSKFTSVVMNTKIMNLYKEIND